MKSTFTAIVAVASLLVGGVAMGDASQGGVGPGGAKVVCEGGVCRLVDAPEEAGSAWMDGGAGVVGGAAAGAAAEEPMRIAQGYMPADKFISFLKGEDPSGAGRLPTSFLILPFFLILAGLALNLTPCVLPMIPVNLIVIGQSVRRGLLYGLGMALAYGALGVAAAVGGLAFGAIQSSPWFNAAVAVVFVLLSLSLFGVFAIDFSGRRTSVRPSSGASQSLRAFFLGVVAALLAGACVAPVLVSVLLLTADLFAKGNAFALALPLFVGVGMALPWPFLGAGMKVLPKPGAWMKWVNRVFGIVVLGFAAWYGALAWNGLRPAEPSNRDDGHGAVEATPATFAEALASARRPVLVDCWASWCKNCAAMDKVIAEKSVRDALDGYTVIRLRAEDIGELRKLPGFGAVQGLPAFAVIGEAE